MPLLSRIMASGASALLAKEIIGTVSTIAAAGTTQLTATALPNAINNVTTVAAGAGVILPTLNSGETVSVENSGANVLLVYPPVGGTISGQAVNVPADVEIGDYVTFTCGTLGINFFSPSTVANFGSGNATIRPGGQISVQAPGVTAAVNPGATAADNVLAVYSIPANTLDGPGLTIEVLAAGLFAANGNTKTVKLFFNPSAAVVGSTITGGTLMASSGAVTTSGGGWTLQGAITKRGVAGANTQTVFGRPSSGAAAYAIPIPVDTTAVETAAILIAVTGNAATTATDIGLVELQVKGMDY